MRFHFLLSLLASLLVFESSSAQIAVPPQPCYPIPSPQQVQWQQLETYAFVHFGLNTFLDQEWGYGDAPLQAFNPTQLDCEQWVKTFVAAGLQGVILTCKHHDGFCLWPTQYTDYCIRNTPYLDGNGDIVRQLSEACRKYGIKFGIYLSPWDRHQAFYGLPFYRDYYYAQLEELLTNYGEIFEVWFDGANGGDGWYGGSKETRNIDRRTYYEFPRAFDLVHRLQPNAIIFSDGGPGCRWVGNELGFAFATNWSMLRAEEVYPGYPDYQELQCGHADGNAWIPAECNVSIRPGWFYHTSEDSAVKSIDKLTDLYYRSVGHNATFLLNFPVGKNGKIHPIDSTIAVNWYQRISSELNTNLFANAIFSSSSQRGDNFAPAAAGDQQSYTYWATPDSITTAELYITLNKPQTINRILIQEYIPLGQRVKSFSIQYKSDNAWVDVEADEPTTTIGYKRIVRIPNVFAKYWRICINDARACPCISNVAAYFAQ